jgi:hypothetical protein
MSPAPKYRARTCNTEVETKGVGDGQRGSDTIPLFLKVAKRIEGTGMANKADVLMNVFSGRFRRGER